MNPILYSFKRCPYAMRARMVLKLANIKCELREVRLNNKPKQMLQVSPKGTVPVMVVDNQIIDESLDIINWALTQNDIFKGNLSDGDLLLTEELISIFDNDFKKTIYEMSTKIVDLEDKFIDLAYKNGDIEGLPKKDVKKYIRYITDRRLLQLGLKTNFKVKDNPIPWLEWILNAADHTNFFENRVTEYEVAGLTGRWDDAYEEKPGEECDPVTGVCEVPLPKEMTN